MLPLYILQSYPFYSRPQFMIPFMFIISTYRNKVNTNGLEFMKFKILLPPQTFPYAFPPISAKFSCTSH